MGSVTMPGLMRTGLVLFLVLGAALAKNDNVFSRLIDDLFADGGYEKDAIPMKKPADKESNINAINVGVGLSIIDLDYDPSDILSASTWFKAAWEDYRLKWDPEHYDGLSSIKIPASRIWTPDLSVYNAVDFGAGSFADLYANNPTNAVVYNTGKVLWIPAIPMKVYCNNGYKATHDPSDNYALECKITIGSWTYDGFHLNMTAYGGEEYMELSDMTRNSRYVVTSQKGDAIWTKYYDCCKETYLSMNYVFTIQKSYDIVDGKKVLNKTPEALDELFEMYKVTFTHD